MFKKSFAAKAVLALGVLALGAGQAQARVGIKGGVGFSKMTGEPDPGLTYKMGFLGGLAFETGMGPVGLMVDVLYAARKFGNALDASTHKSIDVPVQAKIGLMPALFLTVGGYGSYSLEDVEKKFDYGAVGGLGFAIPSGAMKFTVEARYNYGIANLSSIDGETLKNQHADILVGVMF